tara:strand:- start:196 stop:519 length:324 start_codon:yes stop_codon:yes gene_type:complete
MTENLEPLDSQIMTGYMLSRARAKYLKYMKKAFKCLKQAHSDTNIDLGEEIVHNVDLGEIRSAMYDALAAVERVEVAHRNLAVYHQSKLGYRKLKSEDFEKYGGTRR